MKPAYYKIDLPYACYAIAITNDIITDAAPIAKWMIGKHKNTVRKWLKEKKAKVEILNTNM